MEQNERSRQNCSGDSSTQWNCASVRNSRRDFCIRSLPTVSIRRKLVRTSREHSSHFEKNHFNRFTGSTKSKFGAHIGIPVNYTYETVKDIERGDIRTRDKEVSWSSEDGQNLQESLVLSEKEQVFGMARSILLVKSHKLMITSVQGPACLMATYAIGHLLNQSGRFYTRPLGVSGVEMSLLNALTIMISFRNVCRFVCVCTHWCQRSAWDCISLSRTLRKLGTKRA